MFNGYILRIVTIKYWLYFQMCFIFHYFVKKQAICEDNGDPILPSQIQALCLSLLNAHFPQQLCPSFWLLYLPRFSLVSGFSFLQRVLLVLPPWSIITNSSTLNSTSALYSPPSEIWSFLSLEEDLSNPLSAFSSPVVLLCTLNSVLCLSFPSAWFSCAFLTVWNAL